MFHPHRAVTNQDEVGGGAEGGYGGGVGTVERKGKADTHKNTIHQPVMRKERQKERLTRRERERDSEGEREIKRQTDRQIRQTDRDGDRERRTRTREMKKKQMSS